MRGRRVQPLNVVQRNGRVDHEAEHPCAQHVPERHGDETHQGPLHTLHPLGAVLQAPVLPGLMSQDNQRHHFECTEGSTHGHDRRGRAREVQMVEGTWHTTEHEQRSGGQAGGGGQTLGHQAHAGKNEGQSCGGEDFEEALHPKVNHPPAPVLHHRQVRALAVSKAGTVEQTDGDHRSRQQGQQVLVSTRGAQRRHHAAQHQHQPERNTGELADLPEATQVDVFITLVTQHEAPLGGHDLGNGQVVADERAHDHDHQRPEQNIDTDLLQLRVFATVDDGRQEQPRSQEARGNPEQRTLQVPCAQQGVGEPARQREAVEVLTFNRVVSGGPAQEHLKAKQRHHQEEVLAQRTLRRRQGDRGQGITRRRHGLFFVLFAQEGPGPDQETNARHQQDDTDHRPHEVFTGRLVANQRFVRPVVGVGGILPWTFGGGHP